MRKDENTRLKSVRSLLLLQCAAVLLFCAAVSAQTEKSGDEVFRVETQLVGFEVTVSDRDGKPVRGLAAKDFKVFEDGVEKKIDFFEPVKRENDSRPLSIVFALDVSGSMTAEEMARLEAAMRSFVKNLSSDYNAYFAVMTFGMNVKVLQSFTNRADKLEKTFDRLARDQDGLSTHAYDAVDDALRLLEKKSPPLVENQPPKRAVVLITDGFPVGDTVSPKTVIERANDAETSVYSIILPSFSRLQADKKPLPTLLDASGLIERTGGRAFYASDKSFEPLFKSLAEEITASYILAFYPDAEKGQPERFRSVRIEAPKGFQIKQNRAGYKISEK